MAEVSFWLVLLSGGLIDFFEFVITWTAATGHFPFTVHDVKRGKYVTIEEFDEKTGRFHGNIQFSVNDLLGLTDRMLLEGTIRNQQDKIHELETIIKAK